MLPESDQQPEPVVEEQEEEAVHSNDHLAAAPAAVETPEESQTTTSLLSVDTTEAEQPKQQPEEEEDMSSQLNPDALEFVPLSPQSSAPVSPALKMDPAQEQFIMGQAPQIASIMEGDRILAQSPRKNNTAQLDNVPIPDEQDFDDEISNRPHEWSSELLGKKIDLNGSLNGGAGEDNLLMVVGEEQPQHQLSPSVDVDEDEDAGTLNSKEERDLDEEKEEIRDEMIKEILDNIPADQESSQNGHLAVCPGEQDPMNMSFHQDVQVAPSGGNPFDLNAVQLLPNDDIEEEDEQSKGDCAGQQQVEQHMEQLNLQSALPEADLLGGAVEEEKPMELTESESNFMMQQPEEEPERKEFDEKDEEELNKEEVVIPTPEPVAAPVET